jgi:hypothetical protein
VTAAKRWYYVAIVNDDRTDSYAHTDRRTVVDMTGADPGAKIDVYMVKAEDPGIARLIPRMEMRYTETIRLPKP